MKNKLFPKVGLIFVFLVFCSSSAFALEADLILHNAKITTLDTQNPSATAVAIKKGRIIKVGIDADVLKLKNKSTRVLDAQGRRIIPGMNDSHSHYIRGGRFFNAELRWDGVGRPMSSNSQKATSFILKMGMVWKATSESKSMACSKSDDVNVGDPLRSARSAVPANKSKQRERRDGGEEVRWVIVLLKRGNACGGKDPG